MTEEHGRAAGRAGRGEQQQPEPERRRPAAAARRRLRQLQEARGARAGGVRRARERAADRRAAPDPRRPRACARGRRASTRRRSSRRASGSSTARSRRCSSGTASSRSRRTGKFDPHVHEALLSQPSEAEEGSVIDVVQKGYKLGDRVVRPARVVVAARRRRRAMAESLYDTLGVKKGASAGRDQEGVPEARAPVPPGHEPGRQGRGGALQGGADRVRRPLRRREAEGVRPLRLDERTRRARPGRRQRRLRRLRLERRPRRHPRRASSGTSAARGGGARARPQPVRGADVETEVRLSFEDSLRGAEAKVPVELTVACSQCGGTGAEPGTAPVICPECNGRGVISESQGLFALSQPCPRCRGNGTVIEKPCSKCHGSGRERRRRDVHREDQAGRQGRHEDPAQGQGRGRRRTAARTAT